MMKEIFVLKLSFLKWLRDVMTTPGGFLYNHVIDEWLTGSKKRSVSTDLVSGLQNEEIFRVQKVYVIDQAWDAVFHHQIKHREESWKYDAQRSIFDEFWGVWSGDETLCRMLDITSQTKRF